MSINCGILNKIYCVYQIKVAILQFRKETEQQFLKNIIMATIIKTITAGNEVKGYDNNTYFVAFGSMNLPLNMVEDDSAEDLTEYGADKVYLCMMEEGEEVVLETGKILGTSKYVDDESLQWSF